MGYTLVDLLRRGRDRFLRLEGLEFFLKKTHLSVLLTWFWR